MRHRVTKKRYCSFRDNISDALSKALKRAIDYSAFWQQAVLSHAAHAVESQQAFVLSQASQHSVASSAALFELLQQAQAATANIAAATAIAINTFFITR